MIVSKGGKSEKSKQRESTSQKKRNEVGKQREVKAKVQETVSE